jgi:hypothetical protein
MSQLFVDGTAALPLRPITQPRPRPQLRLVSDPPAGGGREVSRPGGAARLTRLGQIVAVMAVALLAALVCMGLGLMPSPAISNGGQPAAEPGAASVGHTLVVQPGDSLWSIATRIEPGVDPRLTVQQLIDRNGLVGTAVSAGQVLRLP